MAGGGSLITFPTLLWLGYPALTANVTNTVGVSTGNVGGMLGYRHELTGQWASLRRCGVAAAVGGLGGAVLLLRTPAAAFRAIVPVLIAAAAVLVLLQPVITRGLQRRRRPRAPRGWTTPAAVGVVSIYGGYFGAAVGVMLIAALGLTGAESLQRSNALKSALTLIVNGLSGLLFAVFGPVVWRAAATLAVATVVGGYLGAGLARRLPDPVLRGVVAAVGLAAAITAALRG